MSVLIEGCYTGKTKTRLVHGPSGSELITGAPRDNGGDGSQFSPTDLVAGAFGSCLMTIIGMAAERMGADVTGMNMRVEKEMQANPRRIGSLKMTVHMPAALPAETRTKLETAGRTCPVAQSLHPEVKIDIDYIYDLK